MSNPVILRTFAYRHEAEPVRAFLEASGIESFVTSDDCGSWDPALAFTRDVRLSVSEDDAARAEKIDSLRRYHAHSVTHRFRRFLIGRY